MKKFVSIVVVFVVLVVGIKFFLEYRYKAELDKAIQQVSLYAEVVYEDISIGFDGTIELLELRVTPNGGFNTFSLQSLKLSGFGLMYHLGARDRLTKGDLPKMVKIDASQLSFPVSLYEDMATQKHKKCRSFESTILYSLAGVDQVIYNSSMEFDLSLPNEAGIKLTAFDQISNSRFSMSFNPLQANIANALGGVNPISSLQYTYSLDETASSSILNECAQIFKVSPDQFLTTIVGSNQYLANSFGFNPGEKAKQALIEFLQGGKEISIRVNPPKDLNIASLNTASPLQLMRMLDVTVSLEGNRIPISSFVASRAPNQVSDVLDTEKTEPQAFKRRDLDELLTGPDNTVQQRNKPTSSRRAKAQYDSATLAKVGEYIDRDVRVSRTKDRSAIEGRLLGSEDQVLSIEMFRYGGTMTFTVPYEDVLRFEIKRKQR